MVIAVSTRLLQTNASEGYSYFITEVFTRLAQQHAEHQFYFLSGHPNSSAFILFNNITPVVISPAARYPLLWKYWYDINVPTILKKIKADVFVLTDGICSLRTLVPQCLLVHDLGFLHHPAAYKKSHLVFYRLYMAKFLIKAKNIVTFSQFSRNVVVQHYGIKTEKLGVVYKAAKDVFQPIPSAQQALIKEKYTDGKEYFVYAGIIHPEKNIINLLKGFSAFKKRQRSNMRLVLCGQLNWGNDFKQLLKTYKYRDDVVITGNVKENVLAEIIGSAYGLVYPSLYENFDALIVEAMQCGIPVLTVAHSAMEELCEKAALYFDAESSADIADKLMQIYKDENLRSQLIEKGKAVAQKYTWLHTTYLLWQCIKKAAGKN